MPDHIEGLVNTRRSATGRELMQFFQAVNWTRASLVGLAAVRGPSREGLEAVLAGTRRTKRVANNRKLKEEDWNTERGRRRGLLPRGFCRTP